LIPLSYAQERLWLLHVLDGPSPTYNIPLVLTLTGELDRAALEAALGDVLTRHESLRTRITETDGVPFQSICERVDPASVMRLARVGRPGLDAALADGAQYAFDLTRELPVRLTLFEIEPREHVLLVLLHHIAADGSSAAPLARDLSRAYAARRAGTEWRQPLEVQYADYAVWQRELLGRADDPGSLMARQLTFWRAALAGAPPVLELPADRPRPPEQSHRGAHVDIAVSAALHRALATLGAEAGCTLHMVLHAAVAALLTRLGAGTDLPIGTVSAGRDDVATEDLIGFFVNMLVLRTDTSGNPGFRELLRRVRETALNAQTHQDVSFEHVVEAVNPTRSLAYHPLTQVMLTVESGVLAEYEMPGLEVRVAELPIGAAKLDLGFVVGETRGPGGEPAGLTGQLQYATDLFDPATAESIAARFVRVLHEAVADPDRPAGQYELLSQAERSELARQEAGPPAVPALVLPEMFERQVRRTPDAEAVAYKEQSLSYAGLNARANRLAHHLIARGAGPERLVAIAVPRSVDLVVVLLAVHKSGAGYLPIDPGYPLARIRLMIDKAAPFLLVTTRAVDDLLPPSAAERILLDVPPLAETLDGCPDSDPTDRDRIAPLTPDSVAYVIYTSGSEGIPKGVVVSHAGLASMSATQVRELDVRPGDRVLQFAALSFDPAVWELCMALLTGATLVLAPAERLLPGEPLARLIADQRITHIGMPPTALGALSGGDALPSLRTIVVGGEACPPELVETWSKGHRMLNAYGLTETTICTTLSEPLAERAAPIGVPITGAAVYVLDSGLRRVPPGVPGEMYLAGAGLARGYVRGPSRTAERFVADPYGPPGSRMYRSGDLAKRDSEGRLWYLGRADAQVKVRGFRVEPGEIETALAGHPDVSAAVVVARDDRPGDVRLVAYVTPAAGGSPHPARIRDYLSRMLPTPMVPAAVVVLDDIPRLPNGKADRARLPAPGAGGSSGRIPASPREEILCDIFTEVLGGGPRSVGPDDDFFALGGHSLLVTRVTSRVRSVLGVEVPMRALFEAPTVTGFAARLAAGGPARPPLKPMPRPDRIPLSHAQQRLWFIDSLEGPNADYNVPVAWRLSGDLCADALGAALHDVCTRHESLRTIFPELDGVPYQKVLDQAEVAVPLVRADVDGQGLDAALREAAGYVFDLGAEPPMRAWLLSLSGTEHVLLILLHHIVADGLSIGPLSRDLGLAYGARRSGRAPGWPPLPVQYADYALWQRGLLDDDAPDGVIARQVEFWRSALSGLPEELRLPADRPRPAVASHRGAAVPFAIGRELHEDLVRLAARTGTTVFMVVQAALAALLTRLGADPDVPVSCPVAGRTEELLNPMVGTFINSLVLRTDTSGDPSFLELLDRVRTFNLSAYDHQDLPFERLVEMLNPVRSLARHPLVQVSLTFQSATAEPPALAGLSVSACEVHTGVSKLDMSFGLQETRDASGRPAGIDGSVDYAEDMFDRASVLALTERLDRLLRSAAAFPERRVSRLDLLDDAEEHQLLSGWQGPSRELADDTIPDLFQAQVRRAPEAIAVSLHDDQVSYRELNRRANRLARYLIQCGVGPETIVAVALPRTPELLTTVLAVAKAGGAYLPVDPGYPRDRIAFMLADARPALLLTDRPTTRRLPPGGPRRLLIDQSNIRNGVGLDLDSDLRDAERLAPLRPACPAYVIYTSGSTGRPKGVVVSHAGAPSLLATQQAALAAGPGARVLQFASASFDAAFWELCMALLSGGQLVLATQEELLPGPALARVIRERGVTHLTLPPTALANLAPGALPPAGTLVVAGEACPPPLAADWSSGRVMVNAYGPTETTVCATVSDPLSEGGAVPIGRPVLNAQVYVLDAALRVVPPGVPGDVYVAGPSLARGYLNRPALTASRFVACPFGSAGRRMYRTGDLARWSRAGQLEFAGRADDQIKLRGFRIELGEINAVLSECPGVRQTAVVVREDRPNERRLVAYLVTNDERADAERLRELLAARLPDHMVPSAFVFLPELPLTPSGKVDQAALPAPEVKAGDRKPVTSREAVLCELFAEVLSLPAVGADDSFFAAGGDSILAIQLVSAANKAGLSLAVRDIFRHKTPSALALAAKQTQRPEDPGAIEHGELPLLPIVHWLRERGGPIDGLNQSMAVRVPADVGQEDLVAAVQAWLDHHGALRIRLTGDTSWRLEIGPARSVRAAECVRRIDVRGLHGPALAAVFAAEGEAARARLAPRSGVMAQLTWFDAGPEQPGWLLIVLHHLSVDGVSWRILLPDLAAAWQAIRAGRSPALDPVPTGLADWSRRLSALAVEPGRATEAALWAGILGSADPPLGSRSLDPAIDVAASVRQHSVGLAQARTTQLLTSVPAAVHARVHEVLLASLTMALAEWFLRRGGARADVLVDVEGHGRDHLADDLDVSRTVGWFTSLFPVRLPAGELDWAAIRLGRPEVGAVIGQVKERLRSLPDAGRGYGLVRYLNPRTRPRLEEAPTAQIAFNYLGRFRHGGPQEASDWDICPDVATPAPSDPLMPVWHALAVTAVAVDTVRGARLEVTWSWPGDLFSAEEIGALATLWTEAVDGVLAFAAHPDAGHATPSDLYLRLDQDEIDDLEAEMRAAP
jgi:amino acid adenylation domain-containing protein/non-ribosomal peptide synthase protein (TIGR01720 family)